ncbi:Heat shock transcription factor [Pichia kudriavzevii]|uniref:Heat shock transcription factor n=1 Tax=Pichia kudriavzevii TaxID=4909 RepID=A0A1V2LLH8_PICKU|nr:Heat shock transcription factor [Pichia kudriavzevii]
MNGPNRNDREASQMGNLNDGRTVSTQSNDNNKQYSPNQIESLQQIPIEGKGENHTVQGSVQPLKGSSRSADHLNTNSLPMATTPLFLEPVYPDDPVSMDILNTNTDINGDLNKDSIMHSMMPSLSLNTMDKDETTNSKIVPLTSDSIGYDAENGSTSSTFESINQIAKKSEKSLAELTNSTEKSLAALKKPKLKKTTLAPAKRPAFVVKLWKMINDPENEKYMTWIKNGNAFQVNDRENFMKYVLPKYFKHNNFASFVRQLNMYGWHKMQDVNSGSLAQTEEIWRFEHPNFRKGREDLLDSIVRNKPGKDNEEEDVDIKVLMDQLEKMRQNQRAISDDLRRVREDNEMLWKENFIARERHKIQSETLDKIMRFLASIYGNNTSRLLDQVNDPNTSDLVSHSNNVQYGPTQGRPDYNYYNQYASPNNNSMYNGYPNNNNMNNSIALRGQVQGKGYPQSPHVLPQSVATRQQAHRRSNTPQTYMNSQTPQRQQTDQLYTVQTPYYEASQSVASSENPVQTKKMLLLTNRSNNSLSSSSTRRTSKNPNELRMKNVGYSASTSDSTDSNIQEIHRGPENRNSQINGYSQVPDYVNMPRQFGGQGQSRIVHLSPYDSQDNEGLQFSPPTTGGFNSRNPNVQGESLARDNVDNVGQEQDPLQKYVDDGYISMNNTQKLTPNEYIIHQPQAQRLSRSESQSNSGSGSDMVGTPIQIMGNIHQQLSKNQGALKQVNDWLNKYNGGAEPDMPAPDDFKVDDFLKGPLELSVAPTPIEFNDNDFINVNTPIHTPTIPTAQLNTRIPGNVVNVSSKRPLIHDDSSLDLDEHLLNSGTVHPDPKRFKPA